MRFNCGFSKEEHRRRATEYYCEWHRWFAWWPVRVAEGDCRWLETVERRAGFVGDGLIFEHSPCHCIYRATSPQAA